MCGINNLSVNRHSGAKNVTSYILKNLLIFTASMLVPSEVVFVFARLAPGDPLVAFYGDALETINPTEINPAH